MTLPAGTALTASRANLLLERVYGESLAKWKPLAQIQSDLGHVLSIPCFIKTEPAYFSAKLKILVVGQETHGWWTNCEIPIEELHASQIMDFSIGIKQWLFEKYKSSPYWAMIRALVSGIELQDCPQSFLISNVFPCDLDKQRPPLELHAILREWEVLAREVEIIRPDWIIFLCGPHYYGNLQAYFGEWPKEPVSERTLVVPYQPPGHMWKGLVTYHPSWLRRRGLEKVARAQLVDAIVGGLTVRPS